MLSKDLFCAALVSKSSFLTRASPLWSGSTFPVAWSRGSCSLKTQIYSVSKLAVVMLCNQ